MSAPVARVGLRHEPAAGLPFVLTLKVGARIDVHRFFSESNRADFYARIAEHYIIDNPNEGTPQCETS